MDDLKTYAKMTTSKRACCPAGVDKDKTHRWPNAAGLKAETEGFIIAAQD